jgi:hypothetical protein
MSQQPLACPNCGKQLDTHINNDSTDELPPEVGDLSVCFGCFQINEFTDNGFLKFEKFEELPPELQKNLLTIQNKLKKLRQLENTENWTRH